MEEAVGEVALLRSKALDARQVAHGFTTRSGGVSVGPWGPLNLAARPEQPEAHLQENWRRVTQALGAADAGALALLHQVHGPEVVRVEAGAGPLAVVAVADAAYTRTPGVILAVRTADCVPVLVAGRQVVAVAHAGWRGVAARVVPALIRALVREEEAPEELVAVVGPAISGAAYEVGEEVVRGLEEAGLAAGEFLVDVRQGKARVDLRRAVEAQLRVEGVGEVDHIARCSFGDRTLHSYRRDGARAGRMAGVIARWM